MRSRLHSDALLERLLVFVLATSVIGLGLALAGEFQAWLVFALAGASTAIYHWRVPVGPAASLGLRGWHVLAAMLLALAFRTPPFQYVLGGQDPGVYTSVAAQLLRTGGIAGEVAVFDRLAASSGLAEYRRQNYTDPFLPGVYTSKDAKPTLCFQFYHLFPVWLALAASLFGLGASGHGLLFLSLVSILFFQRLAAQLSASPRIGLAAGLLLASNPLHAFFSKFPVTEVPTLAFSSAAFCFLAMYAAASRELRQQHWLVLSALAFTGLFFTRISGFMYVPLVWAVSVLALVCDEDRERASALSRWSLAVVLAYLVSVAYGLVWSQPYSLQIYDDAFAPLFGPDWRNVLIVIGVALALLWAALWYACRTTPAHKLGAGLRMLERAMGPALLLVLAAGAYKAWQLGFTARYQGNLTLEQFPGVVGAGWGSIAHTSLVVSALYLGPLLFLAVLVIAQLRLPVAGRVLVFFVCGFFTYAALLNWVVPYQPYYARYLVSELVPYALLLACCALAWVKIGPPRKLLALALAVSGVGYLLLSAVQIGKQDNAGALHSLGRVAALAGDDDVILLDGLRGKGFEPKEIKTTLVYTYGRHVITIGTSSLADMAFMSALDRAYDRIFVLSSRGHLPAGYSELAPVRIRALGFERTSLPPLSLQPTMDAQLRVFRMDRLEFSPGLSREFPLGSDPDVDSQVGERLSGQGIQALGRAGDLLTGTGVELPAGRFRLLLRGQADGRNDARLLVLDRSSSQVVAETSVLGKQTPAGALAWLDFEVPAGRAARIEVRVRVGPGSRVLLRDYRLTRLP